MTSLPSTRSPLVDVSLVHNDSYHGNGTMRDPPEYFKSAQITFLVILFILIVVGNLIVLAAIAFSKDRRSSRMNFFIVNVAVCDLLTAPLTVLTHIISLVTIEWYAGDAVCRLHKFLQVMIMYASNYLLVALSIDRLDAVARPMQFKGSGLRVKVLVVSAWLLSCLFAVPVLILFRAEINGNFGVPMCMITIHGKWGWQIYISLVASALFFIPAIIIFVCYLSIVAIIFNRSTFLQENTSDKRLRKKSKSKIGQQDSFRNGGQHNYNSQCSRGIIPQAKIRTIKMTFIIVLVFVVCWSPYFIFNLCQVFNKLPHTRTWGKITAFVQSLAPLNSAANPIIYGVFSTRICKYLGRVAIVDRLSRIACKCRKHGSPNSRTSGADYISMSETEDIRLSGDLRQGGLSTGENTSRVPLVHQKLTDADRELLSLHIRGAPRKLKVPGETV